MPQVTTYGDTEVLRRRADQLREQAVDIRALADQLVGRTEAIGWTGRAAESMRERMSERAAHLREAASAHDTAAEALDRHAVEVDGVTDAIAEVERRATSLVADARGRVSGVEQANARADAAGSAAAPHVEADPDDVLVASFTAPPSGHRDWLDVDLPGLTS